MTPVDLSARRPPITADHDAHLVPVALAELSGLAAVAPGPAALFRLLRVAHILPRAFLEERRGPRADHRSRAAPRRRRA